MDSRRVGPGDVFCCLPGSSVDGHEYAEEALANGAVGLLCEHLVASATDLRVVQARVGAGNVPTGHGSSSCRLLWPSGPRSADDRGDRPPTARRP